MKLTDEQKRFFIREGYLVLPGFVDSSYVDAAMGFIDNWIAGGQRAHKHKNVGIGDPSASFDKRAKRAPPITDLIFRTGLLELAEDLLGEGNATVRDNLGQIAYNEPRKDLIEQGVDIHKPPSKHRWHIDAGHGKYASLGSDFSVLCGVALSDGQQVDENRGQFTLFPGSHHITHPGLGEVIRKNPNGNATNEFIEKGSADIGNPMRACLSPGDALICHQRVGHCPGQNLWHKVRINIYFRIVHALIDDILDDQVLSPTPWVGFEGLRHLLPDGAVDYTDRSVPDVPDKDVQRKLPGFARKRDLSHPRELAEHDLELSDGQKQTLISDGYVVLPGAVPQELVKTALEYTDRAYEEDQFNLNGNGRFGSKNPFPSFHKPIQRSEEVLGLFYKSALYKVAEQLLGKNNAILRDGQGQIMYNTPSELFIEEGRDIALPHPKKKWAIDPARASYKAYGTDFMFRFGVCLSEGQDVDENRGQLTVWPGSHLKTHPALGELIETSPPDGVMRMFKSNKMDVGTPERVLLRPGDVVIAHQRLARSPSTNLCDSTGKNIYFRVTHARLDDLLDAYLKSKSPWVGFEGLKTFLPEGAVRWDSPVDKKTNAMTRLLNASTVARSRKAIRLTREQITAFVRDGYVVIPSAVTPDLVHEALEYLDSALATERVVYRGKTPMGSKQQLPDFKKHVKRASQVKDVFYLSGLLEACEQIIGEGSIMVRDGESGISYIPQSEIFVKEGMKAKKPFPKGKWQVLYQKSMNRNHGGGDHNVMVDVALSGGQEVDENRGQLMVWPGSHIKSHEAIAELTREKDSYPNLYQVFRRKDLDFGMPLRVCLQAGDAVITHQRLAIAQGINLSQEVQKNVYFHVHHDNFDRHIKEFVSADLPFYGFEGVQDVVAEVFHK